jgi:hypothetical protein
MLLLLSLLLCSWNQWQERISIALCDVIWESPSQPVSIKQLDTRIKHMNTMIKYMPGGGNALSEDELTECFVYAILQWYQEVMAQANFHFKDKAHQEVVNYIACLSITNDLIDNAKKKGRSSNDQSTKLTAKIPKKNGSTHTIKSKFTCSYCGKPWHMEEKCCKKKRDQANGIKANKLMHEENHAMESSSVMDLVDAVDSDFELLDDTEILEVLASKIAKANMDEEVSDEILTLFPFTTTHQPKLTDNTTPADLVTDIVVIVKTKDSEKPIKIYRVLIDTGCSHTIVRKDFIPEEVYEVYRTSKETIWKMNGGSFLTKYEVPLTFSLP